MHAFAAAGAGFLVAVLWFDLMFDVQVRRQAGVLPADVLVSIAAYYRRVTTEARPMNALIGVVMGLTVSAIIVEIAVGVRPLWIGWASLSLAVSAIGLAMARTVRNAVRLGSEKDLLEFQTYLARAIYHDHLYCISAMVIALGLQLSVQS